MMPAVADLNSIEFHAPAGGHRRSCGAHCDCVTASQQWELASG